MRITLLLLLTTAVFAQAPAPSQPAQNLKKAQEVRSFNGRPDEVAEVTAVIKSHENAWNSGDAAGYVNDFAQDSGFTGLAGNVVSGRDQVFAYLQQLLRTSFKGSRARYDVRRLRFVRPKVVICDLDVEITAYRSLPQGAASLHGRPLRLRLTFVMTKEGRNWLIASAQETERRDSPSKSSSRATTVPPK